MDKPDSPGAGAAPVTEIVEGKTERIASMRHELVGLQRHLLEAQQRITAELQGRAEDADRLEALELRVQEHETKVSERGARIEELENDNARLRVQFESAGKAVEELRRELESRDARLEESATKTRELAEELEKAIASLRDTNAQLVARETELASSASDRESQHATKTELEAALGKHRELTELLDSHVTSLRDVQGQLADRESELTNRTFERDAHQATLTRLQTELDETRRALDAGKGRAQELAKQLASFAQELNDAVVPARSSTASHRIPSAPPPIPTTRRSSPQIAVPTEAIVVEASPPPASRVRMALLVLGGITVGLVLGIFVMNMRGSTTPDATPAKPVSAEPTEASALDDRRPAASAADAAVESDFMRTANQLPGDASTSSAPPFADAQVTGIIVLPPEADGHRVFVDGKRIEPKNGRVEVPCGKHEVQIGSRGEPRALDVACNGPTEIH